MSNIYTVAFADGSKLEFTTEQDRARVMYVLYKQDAAEQIQRVYDVDSITRREKPYLPTVAWRILTLNDGSYEMFKTADLKLQRVLELKEQGRSQDIIESEIIEMKHSGIGKVESYRYDDTEDCSGVQYTFQLADGSTFSHSNETARAMHIVDLYLRGKGSLVKKQYEVKVSKSYPQN